MHDLLVVGTSFYFYNFGYGIINVVNVNYLFFYAHAAHTGAQFTPSVLKYSTF